MSAFVGAAMPVTILSGANRSHTDPYDSDWLIVQPPPIAAPRVRLGALEPDIVSWRTPWWPTGGALLGDTGLSDVASEDIGWFVEWANRGGCNGRLGFNGVTRDQYGSPLGGCTVRLFRTSTDELVAKVTSDSNGAFLATSPYSDGHYMTVHQAGPPAVAGATIDTIIPG